MATPTSRLKLKKQTLGSNLNQWGLSGGLNGAFDQVDVLAGYLEVNLGSATSYTFGTTNYATTGNDHMYRAVKFSGSPASGVTVNIPAVDDFKFVENATGQTITFSNGSTTATLANTFTGYIRTNGSSVITVLTLPDGVSVQTVATNISSVNQVATDSASVVAVAGKSTEVGRLGTADAVADMALLGTTANVTAMGELGTSANVTAQGHLGTAANVTAQGHIGTAANVIAQGHLGTAANVTAQGHIGTAANVVAQGILGTSANVASQALIGTSGNVAAQALIGTSANVAAQALIGTSANIAIQALMGTTANIAAQALIGTSANITAQGLIGTSANVTAQALIGTSTNITAQALIATSANVAAQALIGTSANIAAQALIGTTANVNAQALIGTSANIAIQALLGTSANVAAMALLGTTQNVANQVLLGTSQNVTNMNTLAPISGDITTTAGVSTAVTAYAKQYSFGSGDISTRADGTGTVAQGDLRFRSDTTTMRVYNGTAWEDAAPGATNYYTKSASDTLLAAKAPLASPNFSGTPKIGGSNIITAATVPAGGNTVSLTASGGIADGRSVFLKNDGTVAQINGVAGAATGGTVYDGGVVTFNAGCFHAAENVSVIAFRDGTDGGKGKIIAASLNASTNAFTFGTEVTFESNPVTGVDICYDSASELVHICYLDTGSQYATIRSYSLSGTTPTAATSSLAVNGTSVSFNARITYDVTNDAILVVWKDGSASNAGKAKAFDYSGGSYTTGGTLTWSGSAATDMQTAYDTNASKHLCIFKNSNNYSEAVTLTVSGSGASPTVSGTGFSTVTQTNVTPVALQYHPASGKMMYIWRNNSDNKGQVQLGTYGGSNYTTWTAISDDYIISTQAGKTGQFFNENQARYAYDSDKQIIIVTYYGASNEGSYSVGVGVNGSAITLTEKIEIWNPADPKSGTYFNSIYDTSQDVAVAHFVSPSSEGQDGYAIIVRFANTDYTKFIGFNSGAVSNGAAATIQTTGNVDDAQSGLAIGTSYFVQTNGNLATTADVVSVPAGKALAATKILIA